MSVHRRCGKDHGPTVHVVPSTARYWGVHPSPAERRGRRADRRRFARFASPRWCPAVNPRTPTGAAGIHVAPNGAVTLSRP